MNKLVLIVDCSKGEKTFFDSIAAYCKETSNLDINIFPVDFELITSEYLTEMKPDLIISHKDFDSQIYESIRKVVLIDQKQNHPSVIEVSTPLVPNFFQNIFIEL